MDYAESPEFRPDYITLLVCACGYLNVQENPGQLEQKRYASFTSHFPAERFGRVWPKRLVIPYVA